MAVTALRVASRPRDFVAVRGPDAASYLQAMVSNDVEALGPGESCEALFLTPKARVIAPAGRPPSERGRLPAPHRAGARRPAAPGSSACASPPSARSRSSSTRLRSSSERPRGSRPRTTACRRSRCWTPVSSRPSATKSSSSCASGPALHVRARDRRSRPSRRSGSGSAGDRLREGLLPGAGADRAAALPGPDQPLVARARARRRGATRVRRRARLRRKGGRAGDERCTRWRRRRRAGVRAREVPRTRLSSSRAGLRRS